VNEKAKRIAEKAYYRKCLIKVRGTLIESIVEHYFINWKKGE
jgi:hypothetical protein